MCHSLTGEGKEMVPETPLSCEKRICCTETLFKFKSFRTTPMVNLRKG
jgi:hypothetical protein